MSLFRHIITATFFIVLLSGCATGSIRMIGDVTNYKSGNCEVTVYQSRSQAVMNGMIEEICIVEGSSVPSFDHSIEGAIKKNIGKICQCGVSKAYISSAHTESGMGLRGASYVNLVGFK